MKKNIVIISALKVWSTGEGIGAPSFYKTIVGYVENGWNVTLISPPSILSHPLDIIDKIDVKTPEVINLKFRVPQFIANVIFSRNISREFLLLGENVIQDLHARGESCILYAYEIHAVGACAKLASKYDIPFITRFQGTIMSSKKKSILNHIGYYPHYQALKQKADMVVMTNDGSFGESYLKEIGNDSKVLFLRNGVDVNIEMVNDNIDLRNLFSIHENDYILMTVSRLANWKRVDRAIKAMPNILEAMPNVKLIIVGDGIERSNLEALVQELSLQKNVFFTGGVQQNHVPLYLKQADLFLSLYDMGNLGNPLFEAMKCAKPILTLNNGDTSSLMKNGLNSIVLEISDLPNLSQAILELLRDPDLCTRLGNNARKCAEIEFWSWDQRMKFECNEAEKLFFKKI